MMWGQMAPYPQHMLVYSKNCGDLGKVIQPLARANQSVAVKAQNAAGH
jgi:hypothetical protein